MTTEGCRRWRHSLGAHVLGHLGEDERVALEAHLEGCGDCRAEIENLAPLAGLLPLADPDRLGPAPAPPPRLANEIASAVARERRARRRRRGIRGGLALAGGLAAAAAVWAAIVVPGSGGGGSTEQIQRVSFRSLPAGAQITADLRPRSYGTEMRIGVEGLPSGILCRAYLRRPDGSRVPAGSFHYRSGGAPAVLTSALDLSSASAVVLRAGRWTYVAPLDRGPAAPGSTTYEEDSA